jgi:hypothetical protein
LAACLSAANTHDPMLLGAVLDAVSPWLRVRSECRADILLGSSPCVRADLPQITEPPEGLTSFKS